MPNLPHMTCEEFYFNRIAPTKPTAEDYRELFLCLWREHGEFVFKTAYTFLKHREDARDVSQDAFVRAMEFLQNRSDQVSLNVNFRAWLREIVRNLVYDRFRRVLTRPSCVSGEVLQALPVEQPPEERAIAAEDLRLLRKCLGALTPAARDVVVLRDLNGLSQREVASRLQSTPGAVGVALHRARKDLRHCVGMSRARQSSR